MKKVIILVLVLLLGAAAVVTCPDKQAHKDAIMAVVSEKINEELKTNDSDSQVLSAVFGTLGTGIASRVVENRLTVKNHFLWSTGQLQDLDGENNRVSVGLFGHVFTFRKEDLDRYLENAL